MDKLYNDFKNNTFKYVFGLFIVYKIISFIILMSEKQHLKDNSFVLSFEEELELKPNSTIIDTKINTDTIQDDVTYKRKVIGDTQIVKVQNNIMYEPIIIEMKNKEVMTFARNKLVVIVDKDLVNEPDSINKEIFNIVDDRYDIYNYTMGYTIVIIEDIINKYEEVFGFIPRDNYKFNKYPIRLEIGRSMGAAGRAVHGDSLVMIRPYYFNTLYNSVYRYLQDGTIPTVQNIFFYEFGRNYLAPEYFWNLLSYRYIDLAKDPEVVKNGLSWGRNVDKNDLFRTLMLTQGFVNVTGSLIVDQLNFKVKHAYESYTREEFWKSMEDKLDAYINNYSLSSSDVFNYELLEWDTSTSLDNIISAIIIRTWRNYGNYRFLIRLFKGVKLMTDRMITYFMTLDDNTKYIDQDTINNDQYKWVVMDKKLTMQTAWENFYIMLSFGANTNLYDYFKGTLKFEPREEARLYADNLITRNKID